MGKFLRNEDGHTAIEYGMIAALIAILLISSMASIGLSLEGMFAALLPAFAGPV